MTLGYRVRFVAITKETFQDSVQATLKSACFAVETAVVTLRMASAAWLPPSDSRCPVSAQRGWTWWAEHGEEL